MISLKSKCGFIFIKCIINKELNIVSNNKNKLPVVENCKHRN